MRNLHLTDSLEEPVLMPAITGAATQTEIAVTYQRVLRTLANYKSMPFLELTSVCDIAAEKLAKIVDDLETQDLVKVVNREDISEEIVTLKHKGFAIASSLGS